jgi:hypothetical protein
MKNYYRNYILGLSIFLHALLGIFISIPKNDLAQNPSRISGIQNDTTSKKIKLFFVGDLMGHMPLISASQSVGKYKFEPFFKYIKKQIESYDLDPHPLQSER